MIPLNRQPTGLLDFFGIKNGGRNPQTLSEQLQPEFGLRELYEWGGPIDAGTSVGNLGAGVTIFGPAGVTSDPGNSWHFHAISLKYNVVAGGAHAACRLGIYYQPTATFIGLTEERFAINTAQPYVVALAARDFWLGPGWSVAFDVTELMNVVPFECAWAASVYRW